MQVPAFGSTKTVKASLINAELTALDELGGMPLALAEDNKNVVEVPIGNEQR